MSANLMGRIDVLISGAGPTGLVLALWLARQGVGVRIVDKTLEPGTTSRAVVVHARTLELYRQLGLADDVVRAGTPNPGLNLWVRGKRRAHIEFGDAGASLTPYPFVLVYPQDRHEKLLIERLRDMGVEVERDTELLEFRQREDHVLVQLRGPNGNWRPAKRATWPAATAPARRCGTSCTRASRAAPTTSCSTWPTCWRAANGPMAKSTCRWTTPISWPCSRTPTTARRA
jgi:hypothetical protein